MAIKQRLASHVYSSHMLISYMSFQQCYNLSRLIFFSTRRYIFAVKKNWNIIILYIFFKVGSLTSSTTYLNLEL